MKTITRDKKQKEKQVQTIKLKCKYPLSCGRQLKGENANTVGRC